MKSIRLLIGLLLALLASVSEAKKYNKASDAVLLSNVRTLTLQKDKMTTGRRSDPVKQLTCIGGSGKPHYSVDVMRCKNSGAEYDPEDIQWTCQASLPPEFKLGSTEVICEGYDSPDDQHVLKGSCGVEYRLVLTELGEDVYGKPKRSWTDSENELNGFWTFLFWAVFIRKFCITCTAPKLTPLSRCRSHSLWLIIKHWRPRRRCRRYWERIWRRWWRRWMGWW
jgi:hypothetical protein